MSEMFEVVGEAWYDEDTDQLLRDAAVTAELATFCPSAQKIEARNLRVGDLVFDSRGGTHELTEVTRKRGWVHTVRYDGWPDVLHGADLITIIRPTEES
jgi:hypothetical protein